MNTQIEQIKASVGSIIVGQHNMVELILAALLADGHVLLEGVPGVAKTLAARLMARMVDCTFSRIQFTPDLMPADIIGTSIFDPKTLDFRYRRGPVFANIVLTDEINRAPAKTQAALFEVMEERHVTVDGIANAVPMPFMVMATMNPIEQEGTYRLPEAQLDRFMFKIIVDYPTLAEEEEILRRHQGGKGAGSIDEIKPVITATDLATYRAQVRSVTVEDSLVRYIASIVHATRDHRSLFLGASPRASIGILNASKAIAAMSGRDFVTPDDVQFTATPILRHRIQLTPEVEMEGVHEDRVIAEIIRTIDVPR
ncbi:MAG: MoxR family ATPase [Bacteroidetes bacterium]|nr:MoxR family ATPase [Bacteroidota bacterium]